MAVQACRRSAIWVSTPRAIEAERAGVISGTHNAARRPRGDPPLRTMRASTLLYLLPTGLWLGSARDVAWNHPLTRAAASRREAEMIQGHAPQDVDLVTIGVVLVGLYHCGDPRPPRERDYLGARSTSPSCCP